MLKYLHVTYSCVSIAFVVVQESQQSLSDTIEAQPSNDQRAVVLGIDRHGYSYIHFHLFCGSDLRVYRQKFEEPAYSEPESPPVKVGIPASSLPHLHAIWSCLRQLTVSAKTLCF